MAWVAAVLQGAQMGAGMGAAALQGDEAAKIAKYNAKVALDKGKAQAAAIQRDMESRIEADNDEMASIAQNLNNRGFDLSSGSPLLQLSKVYSDTHADINEMNRQAYIAKTQGVQEAAMFERAAKVAKTNRNFAMLGAATSGGSQVANTYSNDQYNKKQLEASKQKQSLLTNKG
jgi:Flp pilus assembly protein TadB